MCWVWPCYILVFLIFLKHEGQIYTSVFHRQVLTEPSVSISAYQWTMSLSRRKKKRYWPICSIERNIEVRSAFSPDKLRMGSSLCAMLLLAVIVLSIRSASTAKENESKSGTDSSGDMPFTKRQSSVDLYNCNGFRQRRDIRDLNRSEIKEWRTAFKELIFERGNATNSFWDTLVRVHIAFAAEAHGGAYFLPWHRLLLLVLENFIRGRGRPNFSLPYWDWSADADDAALSKVWTRTYVGGARQTKRGAPSAIPNGPFRRISAQYPSPHRVQRDFTSGVSGGIRPLVDPALLNAIVNLSNFYSFAVNTEIAHDIVHVGIGGDMRVINNAPNDPVFYLHHGFVDYIYDQRQALFGVNSFGGLHNFSGTVADASSSYVLQAFGRPASDGFSTSCVSYVPYSMSTSSVRMARASRKKKMNLSILKNACQNEQLRMGLSASVCMEAVEDLEKSLR